MWFGGNRVSQIEIKGGIDDSAFDNYQPIIKKAFELGPQLVVMRINSPGGLPGQGRMIYDYLVDCKTHYEIPLVAYIEDYGASAAYMIACAADEIYCTEDSIVGSIGVFSLGFDITDLMDRIGIKAKVKRSGAKKNLGSVPFEKADDNGETQKMMDQLHKNFKKLVIASRYPKEKPDNLCHILDGSTYIGQTACDIGLVDGVIPYTELLRGMAGDNYQLTQIMHESGINLASLLKLASKNIPIMWS
jgi:signal peptide peptidase SppA